MKFGGNENFFLGEKVNTKKKLDEDVMSGWCETGYLRYHVVAQFPQQETSQKD